MAESDPDKSFSQKLQPDSSPGICAASSSTDKGNNQEKITPSAVESTEDKNQETRTPSSPDKQANVDEKSSVIAESSTVSAPENSDLDQATEVEESLQAPDPYILAIDIGTTSLRSHVYCKNGTIKGSSSKRIEILKPKLGWAEMDPERLFKQVVDCMKEAISAAGITAEEVTCIGLTTQRNTFTTWDRETCEPFHNLITWQDLRARDYVKSWNQSYSLKALNNGSKFLYTFVRKKRFLAASVLKFMSAQSTLRLLWQLDHIENIRKRASEGHVMFGCIETWLTWKLTGHKVHATDYSCAASTGMFDPFQICWSPIVCNLVNIPMTIFPEVRDTSGNFGQTEKSIFGVEIPITSLVGDQSAAMFGECCFNVGDLKCTMGTGTFLDLNTGSTPHASVAGLFPLIGWKIGDDLTYLAEGMASDTGITLEWAQSMGLFEDVSDTDSIARSVDDTGGVYFVPAFSGLQAPINDDKAVTMMLGMQPNTSKAHVVRAILESIAFRFKILYETVLVETKIPLNHIRADGGVCNNDFVVQLMADLTNQTINRAKQRGNMTSLGAAFLAGLAAGVWHDKQELREIRQSERVFEPQPTWSTYKDVFHEWERTVNRSRQWYKHEE